MSSEEKIELYNEIYSMPLEESIKFAAKLFREGKDEQGQYVINENRARYQRLSDLKAGNW